MQQESECRGDIACRHTCIISSYAFCLDVASCWFSMRVCVCVVCAWFQQFIHCWIQSFFSVVCARKKWNYVHPGMWCFYWILFFYTRNLQTKLIYFTLLVLFQLRTNILLFISTNGPCLLSRSATTVFSMFFSMFTHQMWLLSCQQFTIWLNCKIMNL